MRRATTRYAGALASSVLCAAVVLTGCGTADKPSPPPGAGGTAPSATTPRADPTGPPTTGTSPSSGTSSPTTSTPTKTSGGAGAAGVPAAARHNTKTGAEAFVRYYLAQFNRAWSEPRSGLLTPLSTSTCKTCAAYEKVAKDAERKQEFLDGPSVTISSVTVTEVTKGTATVYVNMINNRRNVVNRSGKVLRTGKRGTEQDKFELMSSDNGWRVGKIFVAK